ncbi:hypothetical protein A2Z22_03510 [Candidatus Woesebacteria bacterium RBG_16_34_12]|uniref:Uncharacterized protein n=1 Tax=Candidatus Woesebacteria bacterium RBG_16_34_12 TaxID=1802480 RepID=A0A1F7XAU6_9BACT|nr:MAG: hypothetical protein A2Z22_03510 [Candidatus Woesebacteria bacterium RBG_16_34_12]
MTTENNLATELTKYNLPEYETPFNYARRGEIVVLSPIFPDDKTKTENDLRDVVKKVLDVEVTGTSDHGFIVISQNGKNPHTPVIRIYGPNEEAEKSPERKITVNRISETAGIKDVLTGI